MSQTIKDFQFEQKDTQDQIIEDMVLRVRNNLNTQNEQFRDANSFDVSSEVKSVFDRTYGTTATWQNMIKVKQRLQSVRNNKFTD